MRKLVVLSIILALMLVGCATKYDLRTKSSAVLGENFGVISTEVANPGSNVLHTTTVVVQDKTTGELKAIAHYQASGDGILNNMFKGSVGYAALGAGIGAGLAAQGAANYQTSVSGTGGDSVAGAGATANAGALAISKSKATGGSGWIPPGQR